MSRNPMAGSLRHYKPKRIQDKRSKMIEEGYKRVMRRFPNIMARLAEGIND